MSSKFSALGAAIALAFLPATGAHAQVSADVVKIGLLVDMSGTYSDLSGPGSVIAGRMAVEDFGGKAGRARLCGQPEQG